MIGEVSNISLCSALRLHFNTLNVLIAREEACLVLILSFHFVFLYLSICLCHCIFICVLYLCFACVANKFHYFFSVLLLALSCSLLSAMFTALAVNKRRLLFVDNRTI